MHSTEEDLVARCRTGEADALRRVYEDYHEDVYRLAYRLLGNMDEASDVRQDTFVNALQSIGRFRGDCSLRTWLFTICSNLCRGRLTAPKRRREVAYDPALIEDRFDSALSALDPHEEAERSETARLVRIALGSLPPAERELLVLREYEGLDYLETARIQKCSPSTVGVKLHRARCRLRERIESILDSGSRSHVRQ